MGIGTDLITIPYVLERKGPPFGEDEIRYPEALARYLIKRFSKKGARIFDPFAGLGTTLLEAEALGRTPYGIEADPDRHAWSAGQLEHWQNLLCADSADMDALGFPKMDFCLTCPPYMPKHHKWNPLCAGDKAHAGYDAYLAQMGHIFGRIAARLKKGAILAMQVDNIAIGAHYTPLVADLHTLMRAHLTPSGHITVLWSSTPPKGYPHTDILLFKKR